MKLPYMPGGKLPGRPSSLGEPRGDSGGDGVVRTDRDDASLPGDGLLAGSAGTDGGNLGSGGGSLRPSRASMLKPLDFSIGN